MSLSASIWEVRTAGDDNNGGGFNAAGSTPGTDYSQQDSPQITYTDLVIDAVDNTKVTSAGNPFTAAHRRNIIHVDGGTGFTTGWYEVTNTASGVATLDRAVGTTSSTGGTGKLGGALASVGKVAELAVGSGVGNHIAHVKTGTYTISGSTNVSGGRVNTDKILFIGYNTTRNDYGVGPTFQSTATGGNPFISIYGANLIVDGNGQSSQGAFFACILDGCEAYDCGTYGFGSCFCTSCISHDNGTFGFTGNGVSHYNCIAHDNGGAGFNGDSEVARCISYGNGGDGFQNWRLMVECTAYNAATSQAGFFLSSGSLVVSCISWGNYNNFHGDTVKNNAIIGCASGGASNLDQTTNISGNARIAGHIPLTADPFNDASTGDFSLNSDLGGGERCKTTGKPSPQDIGAVQTNTGGTGRGGQRWSY